jgi:hypothetical protein
MTWESRVLSLTIRNTILIKMKKIYWIKNNTHFSPRVRNLMNSIERFTDVVVEECANLNELKIDSENFIVFFQIVPDHSVENLIEILKMPDLQKKVVIVSVGDKPFYDHDVGEASELIKEIECPVINVTGARHNDNTIAGYGFMHENMPESVNLLPFEKKISKFNFAGSLIGDERCLLLTKFKQLAPTNFNLQKTHVDQNIPEILIPDLSPKADFFKYMENMEKFKFSLVPLGYGHTFRFLESMSAGSLIIAKDLSNLRFNKPYFFKPGFNYVVVRDDLADVEDIINMCLERPELSEIAQNGKNTYLKYFSTTKGCLPFITIGAMLKELNHKIGKQFFRYTLKYNC